MYVYVSIHRYQGYWSVIESCLTHIDEKNRNKVGYLTIQESLVAEHKTQRRNGLHVEAPGSNYNE